MSAHRLSRLLLPLVLVASLAACGSDPVGAVADDADGQGEDLDGINTTADVSDALDSHEPTPRFAWKLCEATLELPVTGDNPYDPNEIDVMGYFTAPDGGVYAMPAFVYQGFERSLVEGREVMKREGERQWRVRFRPPFGAPAGLWTWRWQALAEGAVLAEASGLSFEAEVDPAGHGLVMRSPHDTRYLAHQDGSSFFAVGENMAWYDGRGTYAYDDWLQRLAAQGGNYIRLWMPSWAFGLEWTAKVTGSEILTSSLGNYDARLDRAWKLDYVLDLAESLGVQVMLTLQNHGPFSTIHASEWDRNPYNSANGGPLARPADVFTNAEAAELFRRRFRYIVARWGHSPQILAWELWNEFDLVTSVDSPAVKDWTVAMAAELRRLDPYGHLITTSIGGLELFIARYNDEIEELSLTDRYDFWALPELDFTQAHYYGALGQPIDFSSELEHVMRHLRRFDKPMLAGEAGVNALGVAETRADDPTGLGFHDILWGGIFAESFGTGMNWWWDEINAPDDYDPQFGAVAAFVAEVAFDREGFTRHASEISVEEHLIYQQALVGTTTTLVWLKDTGNMWFSPSDLRVTGAALMLAVTPDGPRRLRWIDPWGVAPDIIAEGVVRDGALNVAVPPFKGDIALRVDTPTP